MQRVAAVLLASVPLVVQGARVKRRRQPVPEEARTKVIAGVPILNYNLAYEGQSSRDHDARENWLVFTERDVSEADLRKFCAGPRACKGVGHPDQGGVPFFQVHASEQELEEVLGSVPGKVEFVEPDTRSAVIPELPTSSNNSPWDWGLKRVGVESRALTGNGVHVYVLDTGIRASHEDFDGRAVAAVDLTEEGVPVVCDPSDSCGRDGNGHGTHCAGTAAGAKYGVAPKARVYGVKVLGDSGFGSMSWSYSALDWVGFRGARPAVASMSLGGSGVLDGMTRAVDSAVGAGVTVVVAGGNSNSDSCGFTPAFVTSAITVGSTDYENKRSWFSNFGSCTNIWAPGSDITSAAHDSDTGSTGMSGTSMACPHVSGAAALALEENPSRSAAEVLQALLDVGQGNAIADLYPDDTNTMIWVGADAAPVPSPTAAPPSRAECGDMAVNRWPDNDGDCKCKDKDYFTAQYCTASGAGSNVYDCPQSGRPGKFVGFYFFPNCTVCECMTNADIKR